MDFAYRVGIHELADKDKSRCRADFKSRDGLYKAEFCRVMADLIDFWLDERLIDGLRDRPAD